MNILRGNLYLLKGDAELGEKIWSFSCYLKWLMCPRLNIALMKMLTNIPDELLNFNVFLLSTISFNFKYTFESALKAPKGWLKENVACIYESSATIRLRTVRP